LSRLLDKSLVVQEEGQGGGTRFAQLVTLRRTGASG